MNLPGSLKRERHLMGSSEVIPIMRKSSFKNQSSSQGRVATWLLDTAGFEQCSKGVYKVMEQCCFKIVFSIPLNQACEKDIFIPVLICRNTVVIIRQ